MIRTRISRQRDIVAAVAVTLTVSAGLAIYFTANDHSSAASSPGGGGGVLSTSDARVQFQDSLFFQPNATSTGATLAVPALTAAQAYADYANGNIMQSGTTYEYGTLTEARPADDPDATGANAYLYDNVPVWAYWRSDWCLPAQPGPGMTSAPTTSGCTVYSFVNANTGEPVEETETQGS